MKPRGRPASDGAQRDDGDRDRAQYGVAVALAGVGIATVIDATVVGRGFSTADPVGPAAFPAVLGVGLIVVAGIYARDVGRGGRGEIEDEEDADVTTPTDWRTLLVLAATFAASAVLLESLGWIISSAGLFFGATTALGAKSPLRSLAISVALAVLTYYVFAVGLGINLPAGLLRGLW